MKNFRERLGVMAIVGGPTRRGPDPLMIVEAALLGGASAIQLRWKDASSRDLLDIARILRPRTLEAGALLIINDRVDIALLAEADGAHLGDDDLPLAAARRIAPPGFLLGQSVDNVSDAVRAEEAGANYVGLGPIFPTTSKLDTGPVVGLEGIGTVRAAVRLPIVAIGAIDPGVAADAIRAGADGVAVIGAIANHPDPRAATAAIVARVRAGLETRTEG